MNPKNKRTNTSNKKGNVSWQQDISPPIPRIRGISASGQHGPSHLGRVSSASALYTGQVDRCHVHVGVWIERR